MGVHVLGLLGWGRRFAEYLFCKAFCLLVKNLLQFVSKFAGRAAGSYKRTNMIHKRFVYLPEVLRDQTRNCHGKLGVHNRTVLREVFGVLTVSWTRSLAR